MKNTPKTDQQFLDIFVNRLKKVGVEVVLWANYPWIYIHSINGKIVTEKFEAEHGFTIAFFPVNIKNPPHFTNIKEIFKLIRIYTTMDKDIVKIKLTKVNELKDAVVPNNIKEGDYRIGYVHKKKLIPIVGLSYYIPTVIQRNDEHLNGVFNSFYTSQVIEIIDELTFKTLNSIYKIEIL